MVESAQVWETTGSRAHAGREVGCCARQAAQAAAAWIASAHGAFGAPWQPMQCDRLTLVAGIDPGAAAVLAGAGIATFADIAALMAEDVAELGNLLGDHRRINRQGWIEQAALLARGIDTAFSAKMMGPLHSSLEIVSASDELAQASAFQADEAALMAAVAIARAAADAVAMQAAAQAALDAAVALAMPVEAAPVAEILAAVPAISPAQQAAEAAAQAEITRVAALLPAPAIIETVAVQPIVPVAPVATAEVVALADRRPRARGALRGAAVAAGRWTAVAASVAVIAGLALQGTGLAPLVMQQVGLTLDSCSGLIDCGVLAAAF